MIAPIDVTDIRIETEHLILRPWSEDDLEDLFAYASIDGVGQMAGWLPHKNRDESRKILQSFIDDKKTLAVELKEHSTVIGSIGLENCMSEESVDPNLSGRELGYVLNKAYWGKGLMPEAVKAIIEYCFQTLNYDFLTCCHFQGNNQSHRVIEKSGFHYIKDFEDETRFSAKEKCRLYILYNER